MTKELKLHEKKMINRVKDNIKLSGHAWRDLLEDFKNNESKRIICAKYKIKPGYYKWVKKIVMEGM